MLDDFFKNQNRRLNIEVQYFNPIWYVILKR